MELTKGLLFAVIITAEIIGLVLSIWATCYFSIHYLQYTLVGYIIFATVTTVGTCITLTEIND